MPKTAITLVTLTLFSCGLLICETRPAPLVQKDLVGAWAGCAQGCTEFYRLDLKSNGTGTFVVLSPRLEEDVYVISDWTIQADRLSAVLKPHREAEPITMKSLQLGRRYVQIEIQGLSVKWKRIVTLYNEKDWEERTRRSRDASSRVQPH